MRRWLDETQLRAVRALLQRALVLLPDPDAPVHARAPDTKAGTLCGRGGERPQTTNCTNDVTCKACRAMPRFEPWRFRREP